jgi:hypothetical protein
MHLTEKTAITTLCGCFNKSQFKKAGAVLPQAWRRAYGRTGQNI